MGSEWKCLTVKKLVEQRVLDKPLDGNHGSFHPKGDDFVEIGIPFIMASDLINSHVDLQSCKYISFDQAQTLRKGFSIEGDVLLSHKATIGRTAIVGKLNTAYIMLTPQVTYYRVIDSGVLNNKYLKYYFDSKKFQDLLNSWAGGGSTRAYLGITAQLNLPIDFPPIQEQRAIAHILGTLDDKIELNRKMNHTLEAMAQALFKSWFIDFDPVIDNALAAGNPIPEELQQKAAARESLGDARKPLPEHIRNLFPATFRHTDQLGWVPEGWEVKQLSGIIDIIGGGTPKTTIAEYWGGNIPWFSVVDAPVDSDVFVIETEKYITQKGVENSSTKILPIGTTIISARGTVGKCALVGKPMAMNQSCYGIRGIEGISDIFVYFSIREQVSNLVRSSHGSVFNTITRNTFDTIQIPIGDIEITKVFEKQISPLFNKILANITQYIELTKLRDTLLPKLLSGELRIPAAEKLLEENV